MPLSKDFVWLTILASFAGRGAEAWVPSWQISPRIKFYNGRELTPFYGTDTFLVIAGLEHMAEQQGR